MLFEGKISVKAALASPYRTVEEILIDASKKDKDTAFILKTAETNNVPVKLLKRDEIDALATGKTHGGILAYCKQRTYQPIAELLNDDFVVLIEGVEDPYNFGQMLRSLYAAGAQSLLLPPRNWTSAAETIVKSSAGASEFFKIHVYEDASTALDALKNQGIKVICANRSAQAIPMYEVDMKQKLCLCIGGEKRGLSKTVLEKKDKEVYIPYQNHFRNALSASSAATVLAYEVLRQRQQVA